MSILETSLRERMKLLEQQADQYAVAVDSLSNRLAEALRRLASHDPDYVREEAPADAAAPAVEDQGGSVAPLTACSE